MRVLSLWRGWIEVPAPFPTMREVAEVIGERHGVTMDELRSRSRLKRLVSARREAWAACKAIGKSTTQIGAFFGRDHSTVVHGLRRAGL